MLDWRSFKLPRVSRSSLNAEAQSAADTADALEYAKAFWNLLHHPDKQLLDPTLRTTAPSAMVIDAKSMCDTVKKETPVQSAACKRTAVELLVYRQTLKLTSSVLRWVSSERQLADGLTKVSARQLFADRLKVQRYRLVYDPEFVAAKKRPLRQERLRS